MTRVQVLVEDERNRRTFTDLLDSRYTVVEEDELVGADAYLVDDRSLPTYRDALVAHKRGTHPTFCPVVLIRREDTDITVKLGTPDEGIDEEFQLVDGTIPAPVDCSTLFRRMENLLARREQSIELTQRYERTQARFEGLFETIPDPAFVVDDDGTVSAANRAFRELVAEDDTSSVVGHEPSDFRVFEACDGLTSAVVPGTGTEPPDEPFVVGDRNQRYLELRSRSKSVDGERANVVVMHDVTDLVETNRQLEDFTSIVTHDLRNPMNVAMARLTMLRNRFDDGDATDHIDVTADALNRMNDLIEGVRTLVRETTVTDAETVAVDGLARDAWETVETDAGALVVEEELDIVADEQRLRQLFENLFRNSVEHGEEGVTVEVGRVDDGFYVADDGPGIPSEHRREVFDSGFSTSSGGTGLGLKIVSEIVSAHGWCIDVTESADGGARFEVSGVERRSN